MSSTERAYNGASLSIGATIEDLRSFLQRFWFGCRPTHHQRDVRKPVKILNNGMVIRDVSGLGVDHINDVDMNQVSKSR